MDDDIVEGQEQTTETQETEQQESVSNPAWESYRKAFADDPSLSPIADKIFDTLKPQLAEQDKHFQALSEQNAKLKDYQEFVDAGLNTNYLRQSVQAFNTLNRSPEEFYKTLGEYLGISTAEAKKVVNESVEEADEEEIDPQVKALRDELENFKQQTQKEKADAANAREVARWSNVIDEGMKEIRAKHASSPLAGLPLSESRLFEIMHNQPNQGQDLNPAKAYDAWVAEVNMYRSFPTAGAQAPRLTPQAGGGTSLPLNTEDGTIPAGIVKKGGFDALTKWAMENVVGKNNS